MEHRHDRRVIFEQSINIHKNEADILTGTIKNISCGGLAFVSSKASHIAKNDLVLAIFHLNGNYINLYSQVIRLDENVAALMFIENVSTGKERLYKSLALYGQTVSDELHAILY